MSDIPYSVRDKSTRVNAIKGFNFDSISTNELFKKQDDNNVTGADVYAATTSTSNTIILATNDPVIPTQVGYIQGEIDGALQKLHLTATGDKNDGITIASNGRIGIGVTDPEEDLELDGNIQLDTGGAQRGRVIFYDKQNDHEHAEVDGLGDGTNGGALAFYTKVDGLSVTEKLRINNVGAFALGGTNYGKSGEVLVSKGTNNAPVWEGPALLSASGTGVVSIPINTDTALNWSTITTVGDASASDLPAGGSIWTASNPGLYHIEAASYHISTVYDQVSIHKLKLQFRPDTSSAWTTIGESQLSLGAPGDQAHVITCDVSRYVNTVVGNQLRIVVFCRVQSGGSFIDYNDGRTIFQLLKVK